MFVKAYLPTEIELPQAVQHNANGDTVVLEIRNYSDQTVQLVVENDKYGDMRVRLRGWGNMPAKLGNWDRTSFEASIPTESPTHCEKCYCHLDTCTCKEE